MEAHLCAQCIHSQTATLLVVFYLPWLHLVAALAGLQVTISRMVLQEGQWRGCRSRGMSSATH